MASTTSRVSAWRLRRAYSLRNQRPRADSMTVAQIASYSDSEGGAEGGAMGERANGSLDMITHATTSSYDQHDQQRSAIRFRAGTSQKNLRAPSARRHRRYLFAAISRHDR